MIIGGVGTNGNNAPTLAEVKALALTDYAAATFTTTSDMPGAKSYTEEFQFPNDDINPSGYSYSYAGLYRCRGHQRVPSANSGAQTYSRSYDFYYWPQKITSSPQIPYDKLGDSVANENILTKWRTESPGTAALTETSTYLPNETAAPAWATDYYIHQGADPSPIGDEYEGGYQVPTGMVIVKWTFND